MLIYKLLLQCPHGGAKVVQSRGTLGSFCGGLPAWPLFQAGRHFNVLLLFLLKSIHGLTRCFPFLGCFRLDSARHMRVWTFTRVHNVQPLTKKSSVNQNPSAMVVGHFL